MILLDPLSNDEQIKLFKELPKARDKLILTNLKIAAKYAHKYRRRYPYMDFEILFSDAYVTLIEAIDNFELREDNNVTSYIGKSIDLKMRHLVYNHFSGIYIPPKCRKNNHGFSIEPLIYDPEWIDDFVTDHDNEDFVRFILSKLEFKYATIIKLHFGLFGTKKCTLKEIAEFFGRSSVRICYLKNKTLGILEEIIKEHG